MRNCQKHHRIVKGQLSNQNQFSYLPTSRFFSPVIRGNKETAQHIILHSEFITYILQLPELSSYGIHLSACSSVLCSCSILLWEKALCALFFTTAQVFNSLCSPLRGFLCIPPCRAFIFLRMFVCSHFPLLCQGVLLQSH